MREKRLTTSDFVTDRCTPSDLKVSSSRYRLRDNIGEYALNPISVVSGKTEVENRAGTQTL